MTGGRQSINREIGLLCHGQAKKWNGCQHAPAEIQVNMTGAKPWRMNGERAIVPDASLVSPAERAFVTAQTALKAGGWPAQDIVTDMRVYQAPGADHLAALSDQAAGCMLCVGHPKALTDVLHHLAPDCPVLGHPQEQDRKNQRVA